MVEKKVRSSNIELLKIIAMLLIIISHFILTFQGFQSLGNSTDSIQIFVLNLFQYFGTIGNFMFFICSAWFLIDSPNNNKKKLLGMILNVWVVSVVLLLLVMVFGNVHLHGSEIMKCLLPTTFQNNWYITCYILFCLLYPTINSVLKELPKRKLLSFLFIAFFLDYFLGPLTAEWGGGNFYLNWLVAWILVYSLIFYFKRYAPQVLNSKKINGIVFLVSIAGWIGLPLATNVLAKHIAFFEGRLLWFDNIGNIFLITLAISVFNLIRQVNLQSAVINRISACTIYIYIFHENLLLKRYYRTRIFEYLQAEYGFQHIFGWIILLSIITFIICTILALIYQKTLQVAVNRVVDHIYPRLRDRWNRGLDAIQDCFKTVK